MKTTVDLQIDLVDLIVAKGFWLCFKEEEGGGKKQWNWIVNDFSRKGR